MWSYVLIIACWIYVCSCNSFFPRSYGYGGSYNFQQSTPCKVSNWGIWGQTDYYCIQRRYRRITEYPTKGGYRCPALTETRTGKMVHRSCSRIPDCTCSISVHITV